MAETSLIMTFPSTHSAMKAERALSEANLRAIVIPVPRHITADCGIALRFSSERRSEVEAVLASVGVEFKGVYEEVGAVREPPARY